MTSDDDHRDRADRNQGPALRRPEPQRTPRSEAERAAREARLAAEMRKNLHKRKRQVRERDGT